MAAGLLEKKEAEDNASVIGPSMPEPEPSQSEVGTVCLNHHLRSMPASAGLSACELVVGYLECQKSKELVKRGRCGLLTHFNKTMNKNDDIRTVYVQGGRGE